MYAISINSYDWDSSESKGKRPKPTPLQHMRLWFSNASGVTIKHGTNKLLNKELDDMGYGHVRKT